MSHVEVNIIMLVTNLALYVHDEWNPRNSRSGLESAGRTHSREMGCVLSPHTAVTPPIIDFNEKDDV